MKNPAVAAGVCGAQRNAAGLLATVVSYKAFAEFFVFAVTLAALIANAFATFRVLALAVFAIMSFNAFPEFFAIAVTLVTFTPNVLAALFALFTIPFLDFRHAAIYDRRNRWRLKSGRWRRSQCERRKGNGEPKTD